MISQESIARLEEAWNKLGGQNRIRFYENLKSQCFNYGCQSDTPDSFLVMLEDDVKWWKERLEKKG